MKRFIPKVAVVLLFLGAAPAAWACPGCRAQVNSGVYGPGFTTTLLAMLLPVVTISLALAALVRCVGMVAVLQHSPRVRVHALGGVRAGAVGLE